ncbi:MerR family transcriptional regulator [Candidatus Formimonas warabiya]|uniref:MerR family transcriptional regulator n=1 Tax=Formimonas warabiya TaxID=1761012 RepID=A0A3G1KWP5_FORW1|nr:MerR family transcriptional regulator [Candidatus Formimonas warabiya]ATW26817.1 MerR family transcriptional regulator [Candidatus Formimonas warabiya]
MGSAYLQIEEVAQKTGLTKRTLRYYEDMELIAPVRTEGGYRLYTDEDLDRVTRIKELKGSLGFSLSEIKNILDLEGTLKEILAGETGDAEEICQLMETVKRQIRLVEEKESTLGRVKMRYQEVLEKLKERVNSGKGDKDR